MTNSRTTTTRIWRYEVDEVWGDTPPVKVGDIILDKWKSDRCWQVYKLDTMTPTSGWHCKLLGEAALPLAEDVRQRWAERA